MDTSTNVGLDTHQLSMGTSWLVTDGKESAEQSFDIEQRG
jgi:hypothetical protein